MRQIAATRCQAREDLMGSERQITNFEAVPFEQRFRRASEPRGEIYYKSPRGARPGAYEVRRDADDSIVRGFRATDQVEWVD
jgi:hypothetical protein